MHTLDWPLCCVLYHYVATVSPLYNDCIVISLSLSLSQSVCVCVGGGGAVCVVAGVMSPNVDLFALLWYCCLLQVPHVVAAEAAAESELTVSKRSIQERELYSLLA